MIKDSIDTLEDENSLSSSDKTRLAILNYLYDLVEEYTKDNNISDTSIHTAPNGKKYTITYDTSRSCYISPQFVSSSKCFVDLAIMKNHININNPKRDHIVDTSWSTSAYTAPNSKVYNIQKTTDNRYFSYRFI